MYASDRKHGLATPAHAPVASHAATALEALEAALTTEDWELVEDAYLLLEGVVNRLRAGEAGSAWNEGASVRIVEQQAVLDRIEEACLFAARLGTAGHHDL